MCDWVVFWGREGVAEQSYDHSKRSREKQNSDEDGFETQHQEVQVILRPSMASNGPEMIPKLPRKERDGLSVFKVTSKSIT